jgi:negative regulator of flagellin synthesis FlgM
MKVTVLYPQLNTDINKIRYRNQFDTSSTKPSGKAVGGDRVELSRTAQEIQRAKKICSDAGDDHTERVSQIKQQIKEGTYRIDSEKIASKMLKDPFLNHLEHSELVGD